jgi:hypothetical protein
MKILQMFDVQDRNVLKDCVQFCLKGIQHSVQEVRNPAYKCMSELYRLIGPPIRKDLEGLRPAQLEQLELAFAEVEGGA